MRFLRRHFPDAPKYGVWTNAYILTTRDFDGGSQVGISVYALEKKRMVEGDPSARSIQFTLYPPIIPDELVGDGRSADIDGGAPPQTLTPASLIGTMD